MSKVDETLENRANSYGSFSANVEAVGNIIDILDNVRFDKEQIMLTPTERQHLTYQVIKLVRLGATPNHLDSWHDIQGYAKLSEEYFKNVQ